MALNPIEILKDTIASVAHQITITSVVSLGASKYQLNTANTLYLRTALAKKFVTIDAVDYFITDFSINSYITVKAVDGTDQAVTATSFTIAPPLFVWGNPKMVSAELVKRIDNGTVVWPYMWIVEVGSTDGNLDPATAVKEARNFNIFFLDSADKTNWTIEEHYDNDIYTLNNYIEFFFSVLKSRRDLFETDSITYTKDNYVNFGDYIVDEGMKEHIINGSVTGIQLQISIPFIISTCENVEVLPNCPTISETFNGTSISSPVTQKAIIVQTDAVGNPQTGTIQTDTATSLIIEVGAAGGGVVENSMNAAPLTDANAGTPKTFVVTYADLSAVVVTETSDSATAFVGTVPNPTQSKDVYYNRVWLKTGTSYSTYDEPYRAANGGNAYNEAIPDLATIQQLDFTGGLMDKVLYLNFWSHYFRFVGINGGYYDPSDGLYYDSSGVASTKIIEFPIFTSTLYWIIDTLTGHKFPSTGFSTKSYSVNLTNAAAATWNGDSDFFVFSRDEFYVFADGSYNNCVSPSFRPPFNNTNGWSCTPWQLAPSTNALSFSGSQGGTTLQQGYGYTGFAEFYGRIELTGFVTQP